VRGDDPRFERDAELGEHLATTEQRRTQLLTEVTHELRTPITVIRGQMEALLDGVVAPSDEVYVAVADEAARVQRLVDDLTMLSQADEGTLEVKLVELDLAAVAADEDLPAIVRRLRAGSRLTPALLLAAILDGDLDQFITASLKQGV